ncbi:SDR family NAD(P)-dependent oxidoreductase [Kitasatospora hibisci]|uniref:SDR family NAD(P)-dependent oxidoreductase n=1 Tax=Kitasatospora hibisci TaxID=3369522 RepID=UPI0037542D01
MGMVEEFTEAEARAQLDVNFFGALWVSQAVLPVLRDQGHGHLVQVSSIAALGGFPSTGLYSASKFALEGLSEALAREAAGFGVKVSMIQPGGYWTDLYTAMRTTAPSTPTPRCGRNSPNSSPTARSTATPRRSRPAHARRQRRTAAAPAAGQHGLRPRVRHRPHPHGHLGAVEAVSRAAEHAVPAPAEAAGEAVTRPQQGSR